ncbi:putative ADE12-adenylosuccinate synthetase [Jimgerdemannia flammicorona]|uniref:Adenylosuccinate synthetase n=1 Tax=Jimgerdemannia flammicorona TaxID=994334 RepID=A0A433A0U0_9FUNG|nr:putative ADE12-adenylosuccinate synthetase [Jimgerdemannia flammicorona]
MPFSSSSASTNGITVVLGTQWGDEGKGKLSDILCATADVCARCQGGNNAGHTIVVNGAKYDFHLLPSGLVNPKCVALVGSGVVVHLPSFFTELETLEKKGLDCVGRLFLSDRAQLVFDFHQIVDGLREVELGRGSIGTTKKGIGPAYSAKAARSGLRVHHLYNHESFAEKFRTVVENKRKRYGNFEYDVEAEIQRYKKLADRLKPYVVDSVSYLHAAIQQNQKILVEGMTRLYLLSHNVGLSAAAALFIFVYLQNFLYICITFPGANALMLDLDFGTYPYVTSSNTAIGGVCTGLGIPPQKITKVIGVVKAYTTRVGGGPFPSEQLNEVGELLQNAGAEIGVTTGRKRRCGWLDLVVLKYSNLINGYTSLNITKLDVLDTLPTIKIATAYFLNGKPLASFPADLDTLEHVEVKYEEMPGWKCDISAARTFEELPIQAQNYVRKIEEEIGVPVEWIGVGQSRDAMIHIPVSSK